MSRAAATVTGTLAAAAAGPAPAGAGEDAAGAGLASTVSADGCAAPGRPSSHAPASRAPAAAPPPAARPAARRGRRARDDVVVLPWRDRADREVLPPPPRDDLSRPPLGVFSTRSPDRPNPIGLHRVTVLAVDGLRVRVSGLEALDGTPIADVKPVLDRLAER